MTLAVALAGLAILVGLVGIVVPILPGALLVAAGLLGWAIADGSATAWTAAGVGLALLALGQVVKYVVPGRRLQAAGVPNRTLMLGGLVGIVGFFVVPVVGLFIGFVLGVYAAEIRRVGSADAWPSTWAAMKAAGLSILIELASALLAATAFLVGVLAT